MSEPEELKLVESFDELRAGMLIAVKPCGRCGMAHRLMAMKRDVGWSDLPTGQVDCGVRWQLAPQAPCCPLPSAIGPDAVAKRAVFRVLIPPAADEQTTATSAPTTRTRERVASK